MRSIEPGIHNPGLWLWIPGSRFACPGMTTTKKPPSGGFLVSHHRRGDQWASAQTFFLVKYIMKAKMIRTTKTWKPSCLRASIFGSAAHIRNVVTSLEYCASVVGAPSSKVTWPSESGFGILMEWPGKYLL